MRLTTKLLLLVASIITLTIIVNIALLSKEVRGFLQQSQLEWVDTLAQGLSESVAQDTIDNNRLKVRALLRKLAIADDAIEYAFVTDMDGQLFAHSFDSGFPRFLAESIKNDTNILYSGKQKDVYNTKQGSIIEYDAPLIAGMDGKLHLGLNQSEVNALLNQVSSKMILLLGLVGLLGTGLVFFIGRRINLPLSRFTEQLHQYDVTDEIDFPEIKSTDPDIQQMVSTFQAIITARAKVGAELRENEQNLSLTLNSIGDAVIATDAEGKVTRMNPVAEQLTGWTQQEAKGQSLKIIFPIINASTREPIENPVDKVISTGETVYLSNHTTLISRDGTEYQIADSAAPILDSGDIVGMVLVFNDVTEQYKLRQEAVEIRVQLQQSNNELETRIQMRTAEYLNAKENADNANQAKSEFLSSMSHELRTPLNAILGFAQLFEYDKTLTADQKVNAKEIDKAGHHLLSLINEVLDLAKIESGHIELSMESISLIKVVEECSTIIAPLAASHGISLDFNQPKCSNLFVKADYTRLKQVILNLMSNAVKYNRTNGFINISCTIDNPDAICISVSDSGHGIAEEKLSNLFQPFSRLGAEFGEIEGTGIGLVITKQLVELMNGSIGVESVVGEGTTFWVELKTALASESGHVLGDVDSKLDIHDSRETLSAQQGSQARILIAEDNTANQAVFRQQMELLGYLVDIEGNGFKALGRWQHGNYDLLLTDINMPIMDGYELIKQIRQAEQHTGEHIPVIAITANAMGEDAKRCLESGMDGFIAKPVRLDDLKSTLQKWLPKQESSKAEPMLPGNESAEVEGKVNTNNKTAVDISMLKALVGDDPEKHCLLFKSFIDSAPGIIKAIQKAHKDHAAKTIRQQAHKLRSSARSMGAHELADACQALEIAGNAERWDQIDDLIPQLDGQFKDVNKYIENYSAQT